MRSLHADLLEEGGYFDKGIGMLIDGSLMVKADKHPFKEVALSVSVSLQEVCCGLKRLAGN